MSEQVNYFTGNGLIAVNRHATMRRKNRSINPNILLGVVKHYGEKYRYPVVFNMIHNDKEIRCKVIIGIDEDNKPLEAWVDCDQRIYDKFIKTTTI